MGNIHFSSKPRQVTPQIDHLRKMSPGLRFQHTLIDVLRRYMGNIHFSSKLRHVTTQIDCLR